MRWVVCLVLLVGVAEAYRPSLHTVDARVIGAEAPKNGSRRILIKLPPEAVRLHGEPSDWTGIFMEDGQPIPGTGFRIRRKLGRDTVIAALFVLDIHGPDVRIFTESGYFPTDLSDPPDHPPIDGQVLQALEADGKTELSLGVGSNADPEDVSIAWTGVFTKDGQDIAASSFAITKVAADEIRGLLPAGKYPSKTVRFYPPKPASGRENSTSASNPSMETSSR